MRLIFSIAILCLTVSLKCMAQVSFGANYLGGKVMLHTSKIYIQAPNYSQALELSYQRQSRGYQYWHKRYGYPETSFNMALVHYGGSELGTAIGIYPAIQFSFLKTPKMNFFFRIGGGLAYATQRWNRLPYSDSMNNILGSRINNFTMIQLGGKMNITPHWSIRTGLHFFHISNAAARQPNYGINTSGFFIGGAYCPQHHSTPIASSSKGSSPYKKFTLGATASISFAEDKVADGPIYPNYTFGILSGLHWREKFRSSIGLDAAFSEKMRSFYKNNYLFPGKEKRQAWRYSVYLAHEFLWGRVGLPLQLGYYLNRPLGGEPIYQKVGLNYHFIRNLRKYKLGDAYLMLQLKTHYASAEYVEMGLGILF